MTQLEPRARYKKARSNRARLTSLGKAVRAIQGALLLIERKRYDLLAEWADSVGRRLPGKLEIKDAKGRGPRRYDNRPPDYPPGGRPFAALPEKPTGRCYGCNETRKQKNFSGHYYCVTCGQLGFLHGWCGCLSPLYEAGACKRSGRRCKKRGTVRHEDEAWSVGRFKFSIRINTKLYEEEVEIPHATSEDVERRLRDWADEVIALKVSAAKAVKLP